jgi:two-component system NtrC family sensor kinase
LEKKRVLIVEDEMIVAQDIRHAVEACGHDVVDVVHSGENAIESATKSHPDLVLMDIMLEKGMDGLEAAEKIHSSLDIPIVFLTAYANDQTLQSAKISEPFGYLIKPFIERELKATLEMAFYKHEIEQELRKSKEKYKDIFENIQDVFFEVDMNGNILEISPSIKSITEHEREDLIGKSIYDLFTDKNKWQEFYGILLRKNKVCDFEINFKDKSGKDVIGSITSRLLKDGKSSRIVASLRNITEHKNMEKHLLRAERLAGVGQLAAGIAHEIRNPLGNISSSIQFCLSKYDPPQQIKQFLEIIQRNSDNANNIIKGLLDFATPREIKLEKNYITKVLNNAIRLVKNRCEKDGVQLKKDFTSDLPQIMFDEKWLEQSFLNLILNAKEAMPGGGTLTIKTYIQEKEIVVVFSDTGIGIPKENLQKIFDPFFTTKDDGTGLGLSFVYQIINAHNGKIDIESTEGKGTDISLYLPALINKKE